MYYGKIDLFNGHHELHLCCGHFGSSPSCFRLSGTLSRASGSPWRHSEHRKGKKENKVGSAQTSTISAT